MLYRETLVAPISVWGAEKKKLEGATSCESVIV